MRRRLAASIARGMAPIRPERENLDARRQIGIEHPVVPVGRLIERVPAGEPRDAARNAVTLAVLFELEDAASAPREPCGEAERGPKSAVIRSENRAGSWK